MEKILATGGTGYIGSHTVIELIKKGYEVEILDNLYNSKIEVLDKIENLTGVRPKFHQIDMLDENGVDKVFEDGNFSAVIHFAGLKAVGESVEKPLEYYETNIGGTLNILESMKKYGVKKIIFSSSATVYGEPESDVCVETLPTGQKLTNPYGKTKYMIEEILKDYAVADKDFNVTILRYFNPVGNDESGLIGEDPNGIPNNLMPIIMKVYKKEIPELSVFGDDYNTRDGSCIRDYIHVVDLAKGHLLALENIKPGVSIYNLGTGSGTTVFEMIDAFEKASGEKLPYKVVGRRAGDLPALTANPEKAERELGWKAEKTVEDAMRDTINFLRNN
ncbi:UDP-glucose 4-epimerase GalE [Candidatus Saccharibacteria bacterium]|nr:UDP-glucose 4-epimerase GalE [Candidatus Saccharibacteria bacterium]